MRWVLLALAVLMLASCGGSGGEQTTTVLPAQLQTTTKPTTTSKATSYATGRDYLRLVARFNAALAHFQAEAKDDTDSTSTKQIAKEAAPVTAALRAFDNAALRANWPPSVRADVRALIRADAGFRSDLEQLAYTRDWSGLTRDAEASSAAANVVRADLGLPPPK